MEGLRPLGVGELLDAAIRIYRSRWRTLLAAVAIPVLPVLVFSALVGWSARPDVSADPTALQTSFDGGDALTTLAATLVSLMAVLVATSVATAACFRSISGAYVGDDTDWRESLRFGFARFWPVIGLTLLNGLALLLGLLALLVGVFFSLAFYSVAMPALLVEGQTVTESMRRSYRLVKGTGWRVLGIVLLSTLLATIFQGILSAPVGVLLFVDVGPFTREAVTFISQALATVLVTPFTAALTMALYVDLRVRKEGFDLVLWAQRLGAPMPAGGFPTQPGAPTWAGVGPGFGPSAGFGAPTPGGWAPGSSPGWTPPPPPPPPPPSAGSDTGPAD